MSENKINESGNRKPDSILTTSIGLAKKEDPKLEETVKMIVSYPKSFKGSKFLKDGAEIEVPKSNVDFYLDKKIAKIKKYE